MEPAWVLTVLFLVSTNPVKGVTADVAEYPTLEQCMTAQQAWADGHADVIVAKCSPKGRPTWNN